MTKAIVFVLALALAEAKDIYKSVRLEENAQSGYSVEVSISTVFPTITITPANDSEGFCRFTLMGAFESETNEGFYDPRTDYDIANSRIAFDSIDWQLDKTKGADGRDTVSVVGIPHNRAEEVFDEDEGDIVELDDENERGENERSPFSFFRLLLTANEGANGAQMGVAFDNYAYYRDTAETVLVLEWSVDAGYPILGEDVSRDRRNVAMGGCGYNAGPDADDGTERPVRCEVRQEVSSESGAVTIYQSYVHFSSATLHQPNVSLSATPRTIDPASSSAQISTPFGSFAYAVLIAFLVIVTIM